MPGGTTYAAATIGPAQIKNEGGRAAFASSKEWARLVSNQRPLVAVGGRPRITVKTDARALQAYAKLIPRGLEWPSKPEVAVWLSELSAPRNAPGRPPDDASHWLEGAIDIRVKRGTAEGWYPVHYPVTAEFWWHAGRAVGLPKRRADASIVPAGNGWRATATPRGTGAPSYVLDWRPDQSAPAAAVQRAFHLPTAPMFPLNAAFEGPDLMRVQYHLRPPYPAQTALPGSAPAYSSAARVQRGRVRVRMLADIDPVNEDLPRIFGSFKLGDFVDLDQTVPGSHALYALTLGNRGTSRFRSARTRLTRSPAAAVAGPATDRRVPRAGTASARRSSSSGSRSPRSASFRR